MSVMDAIYANCATRSFTPDVIDQATIDKILDAAVHAPTARHIEPWAFAVVQNTDILKRISERAKALTVEHAHLLPPEHRERLVSRAQDPEANLFYNASTLIVIYGKNMGPFVTADCWLAAENLMLAATSLGLGACVIGLSTMALNTPEWKTELGATPDMTAHAAIILGVPDGERPAKIRKKPEVLGR